MADDVKYRFIPLGERVRVGNRIYEVVPRTNVLPCDACSGCAFTGDNNCPRLACSAWDRADHRGIWFRLVDFKL